MFKYFYESCSKFLHFLFHRLEYVCAISDVLIARKADQLEVELKTARPGVIVGRQGSGIEDLRSGIQKTISTLEPDSLKRHNLIKVDLSNSKLTSEAVKFADPDIVIHLAAESHDDRSIDGPEALISSNVN